MSYAPPGWEVDCRCPLCGTACYPPWLTDDWTWECVMGDSKEQVCIGCFFERASERPLWPAHHLTIALSEEPAPAKGDSDGPSSGLVRSAG